MSTADDRLRRRRAAGLAPSYQLFYDEPVHLVRGDGVWVYDADGNRYLDCYNNVPSVGHAHPRVVRALSDQAALLNTHTRYLHEHVVELAERLGATAAGRSAHLLLRVHRHRSQRSRRADRPHGHRQPRRDRDRAFVPRQLRPGRQALDRQLPGGGAARLAGRGRTTEHVQGADPDGDRRSGSGRCYAELVDDAADALGAARPRHRGVAGRHQLGLERGADRSTRLRHPFRRDRSRATVDW